jgi:Na+/proline symporter
MSTSDSSLLAGASVVVENLYPMLGKKLSDRQKVIQTRVWVLIIGAMAVIIALSAATIYELGVLAWSLLLVGLFAPFALGMYWKKSNQIGGVSAYIGGFLAWALGIYIAFNFGMGGDSTALVCSGGDLTLLAGDQVVWDCAFWDAVYIASFPAFIVSMVLMVVVSLATQKMDPPKPITDIDGKPFDTNPLHNLGTLPFRDAVRKLRKEEYDDDAVSAGAD